MTGQESPIAALRRARWNGLWRQGAGTPDDPNNGRLFWRILGIYPSRWQRPRSLPADMQPTRAYWLRTLGHELTRYAYETCNHCGRAHGRMLDTYWLADDPLWVEIVGHDGGCLCPRCFTRAAQTRGVSVYWKPLVWLRKSDPSDPAAVPSGRPASEAVGGGVSV